MKKILLIVCGLILLSTSVNAKTEKKKMTRLDALEAVCGGMSGYAQSVMRNRQTGGIITDSLEIINRSDSNQAMKDYMKAVVYNAYLEPMWSTEENKNNAISEFGNKAYIQCSQSFFEAFGKES